MAIAPVPHSFALLLTVDSRLGDLQDLGQQKTRSNSSSSSKEEEGEE